MHAGRHRDANAPHSGALFSDRFLKRLIVGTALLACLTVAISVGGSKLSDRMALGGYTESRASLDILIGEDHLRLPANVIRFGEQRHGGQAARLDLVLSWPGMKGYSHADRQRFNNAKSPEGLIFAQVSQSTMSRDMSGRIEPIYTHLFEGAPEKGPADLTAHRLKTSGGYANEALFIGTLPDGAAYAVRCAMPSSDSESTTADCQRDIHIGDDLSLLYRFSIRLLPQWKAMEISIRGYFQSALNGRNDVAPGKSDKIQLTPATNDS